MIFQRIHVIEDESLTEPDEQGIINRTTGSATRGKRNRVENEIDDAVASFKRVRLHVTGTGPIQNTADDVANLNAVPTSNSRISAELAAEYTIGPTLAAGQAGDPNFPDEALNLDFSGWQRKVSQDVLPLKCSWCSRIFDGEHRRDHLRRHLKSVHGNHYVTCQLCGSRLTNIRWPDTFEKSIGGSSGPAATVPMSDSSGGTISNLPE